MLPPSVTHSCPSCYLETSLPFTASVFSQTNQCEHCGALALGVNCKSPRSTMEQDQLVNLMTRNLRLDNLPAASIVVQQDLHTPNEVNLQSSAEGVSLSPTNVFSSTHYISPHAQLTRRSSSAPATHNPHAPPPPLVDGAQQQQQQQQQQGVPTLNQEEVQTLLARNSINPASLFPSQISLLASADPDARLRLLELWRLSPPSYGSALVQAFGQNGPATNLQQEEFAARARYERINQEAAAPSYTMSAYEHLAARDYYQQQPFNPATDPVYAQQESLGTGLWSRGPTDSMSDSGGLQSMEDQYGAFEAMRRIPSTGYQHHGDDEMVM